MRHSQATDLELHCLTKCFSWDARHLWDKSNETIWLTLYLKSSTWSCIFFHSWISGVFALAAAIAALSQSSIWRWTSSRSVFKYCITPISISCLATICSHPLFACGLIGLGCRIHSTVTLRIPALCRALEALVCTYFPTAIIMRVLRSLTSSTSAASQFLLIGSTSFGASCGGVMFLPDSDR